MDDGVAGIIHVAQPLPVKYMPARFCADAKGHTLVHFSAERETWVSLNH